MIHSEQWQEEVNRFNSKWQPKFDEIKKEFETEVKNKGIMTSTEEQSKLWTSKFEQKWNSLFSKVKEEALLIDKKYRHPNLNT
jgi:hypothetical protein